MIKSIFTFIVLAAFTFVANAQLVNNGGTILITDGATMIVKNDVVNMSSGHIQNNGTLIVEGVYTDELGATLSTGINSETDLLGDPINTNLINTVVSRSTKSNELPTVKLLSKKKSKSLLKKKK